MDSEKLPWFASSVCRWGAALVSLLLALAFLTRTTADPDLWGYLAFGRLWYETGTFPYHDVFTFLPVKPTWIYHEWGTGALFFWLWRQGGWGILQGAKDAAGVATWAGIWGAARERGAGLVSTSLSLIFLHPVFIFGFNPVRAQVFTMVFAVLSLWLLEKARLTGKWRLLAWLVPLQVIWCNLHGGFVAGLGLIFLYALGEALARRPWRPYGYALAWAAAATLVNPYGFGYWEYILHAVTMPRPEIWEWWSVPRIIQEGYMGLGPALYLGLAILVVSLGMAWPDRETTPLLVTAVTLFMGLRHYRHLSLFFIAAAVYLPRRLSRAWQASSFLLAVKAAAARQWRLVFPLVLASLLVGVLVAAKVVLSQEPFALKTPDLPRKGFPLATYYPVRALECIKRTGLTGNVLTEFGWGEYLLWHLYPQCRVGLDGRYETVYTDAISERYFAFFNHPAQDRRFLEEYPPALVLVRPHEPVAQFLRGERGWREIYADEGSALFQRR